MKQRNEWRFYLYDLLWALLVIGGVVLVCRLYHQVTGRDLWGAPLLLLVTITPLVFAGGVVLIHRRRQALRDEASLQAQRQAEANRWAQTAQRLATQEPLDHPPERPPETPVVVPQLDDWCREATRWVPGFRRPSVYAELYAHLEERYRDLLPDRDPEAAARLVLTAMGPAEVTARQLRRSEWAPTRLVRHMGELWSGRAWVICYRGTDANRYARLTRALSAVGIPYRTEEFDQLTRTIGAVIVPGRSNLDNSFRRDGINPNHLGTATGSLRDNFANSYVIWVRRRDLAASNRLGSV